MLHQPRAERGGESRRRRADLDDRAGRRLPERGRHQEGQRGIFRRVGKDQAILGIERHDPFGPPGTAAHQLADRQCVEELVGDEQQRSVGEVVDARDEMRFGGVQPALLRRPQHRARLDEVELERPAELGQGRRGAQKIEGQRAASGAQLDEDHRIGLADALPQIGAPQPDQLAENLADLGGGDEIAGTAEGIAPRVIAAPRIMQRHCHERRDRERSLAPDAAGDRGGEAGHRHPPDITAVQRGAPARSAAGATPTQIRTIPAISTGIDSSWPIVVPKMR